MRRRFNLGSPASASETPKAPLEWFFWCSKSLFRKSPAFKRGFSTEQKNQNKTPNNKAPIVPGSLMLDPLIFYENEKKQLTLGEL